MNDVRVMIGVPSPGFSRDDHFYDYINVMWKPEYSPMMFVRGQSPARNRNIIIEKAIELECTHVFFLDDDIAVPQDALQKLLLHAERDVVTGLYLMRSFPHKPIIFDESFNDGQCKHHFIEDGETGLIPIVNCGLGLVLIRIEVFKAMEKPWIRLGETEKDHWGDDIGFFNRVRAAGFKLFCDLTVTAGHMCQAIVKPVMMPDGKWMTFYDTVGDGGAMFPMVRPSKEQIEKARQEVLQGA